MVVPALLPGPAGSAADLAAASMAGARGHVHGWEAGAQTDGPGSRLTIFLSGCALRCLYCHNPDSRHMKSGTPETAEAMAALIRRFAPALRAMGGGLTLSGGEPLVQAPFARRLLEAAREAGLHTALDTSGFLGDRADDALLALVDLVLLDIKSGDPATHRRATGCELAPTLRFAERLARIGKPAWVRFVLVPGLTDEPANIAGVARVVAPMRNVEWVEVLPFHQYGAFKWRALGLDYPLAGTPPCPPELARTAREIFHAHGCAHVR